MSVVILRGDAAHLPLPDASVDLIVTSPPYFGQRSYTDGGEHYAGQIGCEATPAEYIASLLACTRDWMRVLKPEGSLFVNLGDAYHSGKGAPGRTTTDPKNAGRNARRTQRSPLDYGLDLPRKTLLGLPWRYALGCMDQTSDYYRADHIASLYDDVLSGSITQEAFWRAVEAFDAEPKSKGLGLILRAEIVWSKPNAMPESVTDRVRRAHEQVFHFTKSERYFAAVDEIRQPFVDSNRQAGANAMRARNASLPGGMAAYKGPNPLGSLPGSVWEIASQPLIVPVHLGADHFAAFPMDLPRRIIQGWSPPGICTECGEGRRPVANRDRIDIRPGYSKTHNGHSLGIPQSGGTKWKTKGQTDVTITGYACACPDAVAPTRPAVVLDPFSGTGTTQLVASVLGRIGVGVDRSMDYCRLAKWRTADPGEIARAMGVPKPPPVPEGQGSLFDNLEAS